MTPTRRGFLGALLAASAAPAIVRADNLMRLWIPPRLVLWGDGVHDDTDAAQAVLDHRCAVYTPEGVLLPAGMLNGHSFRISRGLVLQRGGAVISNCTITLTEAAPYMLQLASRNNTVIQTCFVDRAFRDAPAWS